MKHLIAITLLAFASLTASAQITDTVDLGSNDELQCLAVAASGFDTIDNSETIVYVIEVNGSKDDLTFQVDVDKISGTAGGTITLAGRVGTSQSFSTIGSAYTVTDADQTKVFALGANDYHTYRITIAGTGTMQATYKTCVLSRN